MAATDVGTGTKISFGTSSWDAYVDTVDLEGSERTEYETTHLETEKARTWAPGRLVDEGDLSLEVHFDPDNPPPYRAAPEEITITFPLPPGQGTPATLVGEGFIREQGFAIAVEEKMVQPVTIRWTGVPAQPGDDPLIYTPSGP